MTLDSPLSLNFQFDGDQLMKLAEEHREAFATATPFRHVVIDDFFEPGVLEPVLDEFPAPEEPDWYRRDNEHEIKLSLDETSRMGPSTRALFAEFNGQAFVNFLERLTGIEGLVPDPHLFGGGLHQIRRSGYLKVHADFNEHPRLDLHRRVNVLVYLNKDWQEEWGGHLELWSPDMSRCEKKVLPVFNRFVAFATTGAMHGHPDPLACPPERARRSIALYYYTKAQPVEESSGRHSTLFRSRPGEVLRSSGFRQFVWRWTPPAIMQKADEYRARRAVGSKDRAGS